MEKNITQEMFDMLTSTLWQDYKGYKRDILLKTDLKGFKYSLFSGIVLLLIGLPLTVALLFESGDDAVLCIFTIPMAIGGVYKLSNALPRYQYMTKVNEIAYDIELSSSSAKIIRTKKGKYGIVSECVDSYGPYLRLILLPQYNMIERADDSVFIISKKKRFNEKNYYGIFNSNVNKITVPIQFDNIKRPKNTADLYTAEINGHVEKYNSCGDRILI